MATTDKNTTIDAERNARTGLIYGLNDRPPLRETIFAALQHLLAIFVAIVTPPLIIAGALGLDTETTSFFGEHVAHGIGCSYIHSMQTIG